MQLSLPSPPSPLPLPHPLRPPLPLHHAGRSSHTNQLRSSLLPRHHPNHQRERWHGNYKCSTYRLNLFLYSPPRTPTPPPPPKSPTPPPTPPPPPTPLPEYIAQFVGQTWFDKLFPNASSKVSQREFHSNRPFTQNKLDISVAMGAQKLGLWFELNWLFGI